MSLEVEAVCKPFSTLESLKVAAASFWACASRNPHTGRPKSVLYLGKFSSERHAQGYALSHVSQMRMFGGRRPLLWPCCLGSNIFRSRTSRLQALAGLLACDFRYGPLLDDAVLPALFVVSSGLMCTAARSFHVHRPARLQPASNMDPQVCLYLQLLYTLLDGVADWRSMLL